MNPLVGGNREHLSHTIREYGLNPPGIDGRRDRHRNERGATRVTTSVNPKQSTGRPAGCKACGLFSFYSAGAAAQFSYFSTKPSCSLSTNPLRSRRCSGRTTLISIDLRAWG
jgi:hypothetical protein